MDTPYQHTLSKRPIYTLCQPAISALLTHPLVPTHRPTLGLQVKLISEYCTVILVKDKISEEPTFSPSEAEQLFDAYDEENVNFIIVGKVRDRCRQCYHLPEAIQHHFIQPIETIEDDEMFNRIEFNRFLKPYITFEKKDKYGVHKAIK